MTTQAPVRDDGERAARRAYRIGALVGLVAFLLVLTGGERSLLPWVPAGDFYDAQAESFLDGRLQVDRDVLGIEAFEHDGGTYMYQPPWPAVLRLPVVAVTDRFEGRLGALSMLLAHVVLLVAAERVLLEARRARPGSPPEGRLGRLLCGLFGLVLAGGSTATFLASRPWVYHESAMWGMAWTVVTFAGLLALRHRPSWAALAATAVGCSGAVLSRASVGAGACVAVGILALAALATPGQRLLDRLRGPAGALPLLAVAAVPAVAYAVLNVLKFGNPTSIPFEAQGYTQVSAARREMLAEAGGSLFGLRFAPTTLLHYLRPTGVRIVDQLPFVDFPPAGGPVVGDVTFDLVDHTTSITVTLAALVVAAAIGTWTLLRRRPADPVAWVAVAVGGLAGCATIVPFGYVAQRYHADVVPFLVPMAALGVHAVRGIAGRGRRRALGAAAVGLALATVWVQVGVATVYQRLRAPNPAPTLVAGLLDARLAVGADPDVTVADTLPDAADRDAVVVIGDCRGVYVWSAAPPSDVYPPGWVAAERTRAGGRVVLDVDLSDLEPGRRHALLAWTDAPVVAWVMPRDGDVVAGVTAGDLDYPGRPVDLGDGVVRLEVHLDPAIGEGGVRWRGRLLTNGFIPRLDGPATLLVGEAPPGSGYAPSATSEVASSDAALCERLAASADG